MKTRLKVTVGLDESIYVPGLIDAIVPGEKEFVQAAAALERFSGPDCKDLYVANMLSSASDREGHLLDLLPIADANGIASTIDDSCGMLRLICIEFEKGSALVSNVPVPGNVVNIITACTVIYREANCLVGKADAEKYIDDCLEALDEVNAIECEQLRNSTVGYIKKKVAACLEAPQHKFNHVAAGQIVEYCNAIGA
ncbi:hypothetical protein [Burkholderia multivorans]|uniref:hypothetical protein n=1 Tax=Burkholderia multivorans TaxID=87883 RepID=UPI000B116872|nr:hypothetical protein [Burkholderia multivorans]